MSSGSRLLAKTLRERYADRLGKQPLLAERGIHLSREQAYRLVTQVPQRLSTDRLAASWTASPTT
jgi:hypothetical protein